MWRIDVKGYLKPIGTELGIPDEPYNQPRQLLPEVFWQTGYVDAAWANTIMNKNSMTGDRILPIIIDPSEWVDIDSLDDWRRAEMLITSGELQISDLGYRLE